MEELITMWDMISTGLMTFIVAIVGFFVRQFYIKTNATLKDLSNIIENLNRTVLVEGERLANTREALQASTEILNRLHSTVDNHETRITVLEEKVR
jgi:hypothetical protein